MAKQLIFILATLAAATAHAQPPNKVARIQSTDQRAIACNYPAGVSSVTSVAYILRHGADDDCAIGAACGSAIQVGSPVIGAGVYQSRPVTNGRVSITINPDAGGDDRGGNGYEVVVIVATTDGETHTCRGPLVVENQAVVF